MDASASAAMGFVRADVRFVERVVKAEKGREFCDFLDWLGCVM